MLQQPYTVNIERATLANDNYRKVIATTAQMQLVLMTLLPGERIPMETHPRTTQFIRVEGGRALVHAGSKRHVLTDGDSIVIPPNTPHEVVQRGSKPLQLYTLYAPPEHAPERVDVTQPSGEDDDEEPE